MKKRNIKSAFVFLFLSVFSANCANAQKISNQDFSKIETMTNQDFSTNEKVLAELQRLSTAELDRRGIKYKRPKLELKDFCIQRFAESPNVIVIGAFAYDRGCALSGAFVNSKFYKSDDAQMHRAALEAFGWKTADKNRREKIAELWTEKGLLAFFTILKTKPKELENRNFNLPQAETENDGTVKIKIWVQMPSGMNQGKSFQNFEFSFTKDGELLSSSTLENLLIER